MTPAERFEVEETAKGSTADETRDAARKAKGNGE